MSRGVLRGQERRAQTLPEHPVTVTPLPEKDKAALDVYMQGGELIVSTTPTIVPPPSEHPTAIPGTVASLAEEADATIIDYVVPNLKTAYLQFVDCSGDNRAEYSVWINGQRTSIKRTSYLEFNSTFDFCRGYSGLPVFSGVHISVKVKNTGKGLSNFDATAFIILKDL